MYKLRSLLTSLTVVALCSTALPGYGQDKKLAVVSSFSIIGDFAKAVGGNRIDLRTLVGPNSDAHVYDPHPADALALARADVILVNGLMFEGFMDRLIEASESRAPVTILADGAEILNDPRGGHYHYVDGKAIFHATPNDPHAWQSVANAFCAADNGGCPTYEKNAAAYDSELTKLGAEIKAAIDNLPKDRRVAVVAHNAFRYFEKDYGVAFLAQQGVSTESSPTRKVIVVSASSSRELKVIRQLRNSSSSAITGSSRGRQITTTSTGVTIAQHCSRK